MKTLCSRISAPFAIRIDVGEVADVVAIALEPADHRVLGVEQPVLGRRIAGRERPVVADLVGVSGGSAVQAVAAVLVVRLPGRVRGLDEEVGLAVVVANDECDMARQIAAVRPRASAGQCRCRNVASIGTAHEAETAPVPAVDQVVVGGAIGERARGLALRQRCGRLDRGDKARAQPAVVAKPVDVDPVVGRRRVDLEVDRLALVDADVRRKALDRRIACAGDVPGRLRRAGQAVLSDDLVQRRVAGASGAHRHGGIQKEQWREDGDPHDETEDTFPRRIGMGCLDGHADLTVQREEVLPAAVVVGTLPVGRLVTARCGSPTRISLLCSPRIVLVVVNTQYKSPRFVLTRVNDLAPIRTDVARPTALPRRAAAPGGEGDPGQHHDGDAQGGEDERIDAQQAAAGGGRRRGRCRRGAGAGRWQRCVAVRRRGGRRWDRRRRGRWVSAWRAAHRSAGRPSCSASTGIRGWSAPS